MSLSIQIEGKIKTIGETVNVSGSFRKRELILQCVGDNPMYPQIISVEFVQDKCEILDAFTKGQQVKASINIRGREWISPSGQTKVFNTLQAWRLEEVGESQPAQKTEQSPVTEDLPF